jgi:hypothetical protein
MIKYFILLILLLSNNALCVEPLRIEFESNKNKLRVYIVNVSYKKILVNKKLSFGPAYKPFFELKLEFVNKAGKEFPFGGLLDESEPNEQDIVLLWPDDIIGREFNNKDLITSYSLDPGKYKVRVIYKNKVEQWVEKGVYKESLTSDWANFEVTETDMKNALGENWREIKKDSLRRRMERDKLIEKWKNEKDSFRN